MAPGRKRGANKSLAKGELRLGDFVLAKIKGFPAWPAKICRPEDWKHAPDPKKHFVEFFGTKEVAFVLPSDIQTFTIEVKKKLIERCKKGKTVKYFAQAVEEIAAAYEEFQNNESNSLGNETRLTKPNILEGTDHRVASNDENTDNVDSRADPCLNTLAEKNGAEIKPDIREEDSSPFLKSDNRTTSPGIEPLEHGSPEHRDGAGQNKVNGQRTVKKIAGSSDKRCKDEIHRAKRVPDSRTATDNQLRGPNQKLKGSKKGQDPGSKKESFDDKVVSSPNTVSSRKPNELLKEKPNARVCGDKLGSKSGVLGKKRKSESELEKSTSRADESKHAAKRPRSEDVKNLKQYKKRLPPVGEGKAEESGCTGVASVLSRELVLGVSALGGKLQFDKEVVPCMKPRKQSVDQSSVASFSGPRDKEGTNHPERKMSSSSVGGVEVPAALMPKRRRAVYISDEDDDEDLKTPVDVGRTNVPNATSASTDGPKVQKISSSTVGYVKVPAAQPQKRHRAVCIYDEDDDEDAKTPVHGGHTNVPKATSASTAGPKSANASHNTSFKAKLLAGSAERGKVQKISSSAAGNMEAPAQKRHRAVCLYDEDDDEDAKTPVHGGHTDVPKATSASTDGPKSVNASSNTSIKAKGLARSAERGKVQKIRSSSAANVEVPAAQLPKRHRAVRINDEDPKTPMHGGHTNVPNATSASFDGPKSANVSHDISAKAKLLSGSAESAGTEKLPLDNHNRDASVVLRDSMEVHSSPLAKPVTEFPQKNVKPILISPKMSPQLASYKKEVTGQNKAAKVSRAVMPDSVEGPSNSSSLGNPVVKLPQKNTKQILRSPKNSPKRDQVAGKNKMAEVSGVGMPKKCQADSSEDAVAGGSSSQSQKANQRSKLAFGEKATGTPKAAIRLNDAGVSRDTSVNLSAGMSYVNQERAPLISSEVPDSASSMKDLIAAAQAKRKLAHSHASSFVDRDHSLSSFDEMQMKSHSPSMVQNVSSSAGDAMLIVAQKNEEDLIPSNHGQASPLSNLAENEENKERRVSSGHRSVGGSLSMGTEAAISRDAFEGMLETLSRTKESIGRATRQAIICAKYGIASEVVELLIRKLESEPHFRRKVDLFFLVDSITQCSHGQKGKAGALYVPTVQAALPRLLGAAAPAGTGARDNRHQCRKVMRLWRERKIFPDSLLRRYISDIGASGDDATVGFSLRRPSRSERAVDDPLRLMEGMLVDEYGSNSCLQLAGFFSSHTFGDDEEDEDLPSTSQEVKNTPILDSGKLEAVDSPSDKPHCILEDVTGVLELEDSSCQARDELPLYVSAIEAKEDSPPAATATGLPSFPDGSPPLPHDAPPSPPPLPPCPPPASPPAPSSSPPQLLPPPSSEQCSQPPAPPSSEQCSQPPAPPSSEQCSQPPPPSSEQCSLPPPALLAAPTPKSTAIPPSSITQPSMPSYPSLAPLPGFAPPAYPLLHHEYQISMQRSSTATSSQIVGNGAHGRHEASLQNHQLRPSNTSFLQSPMMRNLAPAPSSHFSLPSRIVQSQPRGSSFPHPYPFPPHPIDGRRHMNEDPWRMPINSHSADTQIGCWMNGRNPIPLSLNVADGFLRPPLERPPSGTMSYQGHSASQMLPSRPDIPFGARWRPS